MTKRKNYILNGIQYLQCGKCSEIKSIDMFSNSKHGFLWKRSWCRECCREYKSINNDYFMEYNKNYYVNNKSKIQEQQQGYRLSHREQIKRKEKEYYTLNSNEIITKNAQRKKEKWYGYIHDKTRETIKELWIRPELCPICWRWLFDIEAHHPDYNKWNEVVFCCKSCHKQIHSWKITTFNIVDLSSIRR